MFPILPAAAILLLTNLAIGASASSVASRISNRSKHEAREGLREHHTQASKDVNPEMEQNETTTKVSVPEETIPKETVSRETQHIFQSIYNSKVWTQDGRGSGKGSTREATQVAVSIIRSVAAKYNVSTMVDAPCGEMPLLSHLQAEIRQTKPLKPFLGFIM